MAKTPHIFTGAGNNFVVFDGREGGMEEYRQPERIQALCREYATDGLMILGDARSVSGTASHCHSERSPKGEVEESPAYDFSMEFYNPDGSGGMMCGNGGRCIVAFADYLGLKPAAPDGTWHFLAPDGPHTATILSAPSDEAGKVPLTNGEGLILGQGPSPVKSHLEPSTEDSVGKVLPLKRDLHQNTPGPSSNGVETFPKWTVRLKMIDVQGVKPVLNGYFLNTGTRHYVQFVNDVDAINMEQEAKPIRWADEFQPEGTNVNFVQVTPLGLKVRTFEKGVEGETLACGTGLTASAIAAYFSGIPDQVGDDGKAVGDDGGTVVSDGVAIGSDNRHARPRPGISYHLQCRRGDWLQVEFKPDFTDVYLTGPAEML